MDDGAVCALVLLIPLTDPFLHRLAPLFRGQRIEKAYGFSASPFHNRVKSFCSISRVAFIIEDEDLILAF